MGDVTMGDCVLLDFGLQQASKTGGYNIHGYRTLSMSSLFGRSG